LASNFTESASLNSDLNSGGLLGSFAADRCNSLRLYRLCRPGDGSSCKCAFPNSVSTGIEVIRFSPDNRVANFQRPIPPLDDDGKPVASYSYQVLYNDENTITMMVNGEKRLTPNADRFVWVLIMDGPDTFSWRETHWNKNARTQLVMRRCK